MIGRNRQKVDTSANGSQSWRDLTGPRRSRVNSSVSHKRRWMPWIKLLGGLLLLLLIVGGIFQLFRILDQTTKKTMVAVAVNPIEGILFKTNGVLTERWLEDTIGSQVGIPIMEIDIFSLKSKLEERSQVKSVSVERVFPSDLRINIDEREPVMRLLTVDSSGKRSMRLVARDGVVYHGFGYSATTLKQLPYLQPYQHADGSYLPLRGMETVVELLDLTRSVQPKLFNTWQVVSLQYYNGRTDLPGQVIEVRSTIVPKIVFGASKDAALQLDRLVYILDYFEKNGDPSLKRIDLSLRGAAAVQLSSGRAQVF
jgi:hypothetical protein